MGERITTERARELLAGATSGPWHISDPDGIAPRVSCPNFPICWVAGDTDGRPWMDEFEPGPGPLADAALIAAAPDLAADLIAARERIAALEVERDARVTAEEHARAVREAFADAINNADVRDNAREAWAQSIARLNVVDAITRCGIPAGQAVTLADGAK